MSCALLAGAIAVAMPAVQLSAAAARSPEIRLNDANYVPRCVTPDRLMTFLKRRTPNIEPRFEDIARWYRSYGEGWRVRWDYAFFQMAVETNFLSYRQPNGRMGDVDPRQNNFAGIGTTGGGVPGDGFPDVKSGVLAQIQHLVAYSGERLALPVAERTRLKQDDIVELSRKLNRPVLFSDLAKRWAVDKNYGRSIEWVASEYRKSYCQTAADFEPHPKAAEKQLIAKPARATPPKVKTAKAQGRLEANASVDGSEATAAAAKLMTRTEPTKQPNKQIQMAARTELGTAALPDAPPALRPTNATELAQPSKLGAAPGPCMIKTASYGGRKTVLIKSARDGATELTALSVLDGFETSMTVNFINSRAPGGEVIGEFADAEAAMTKARSVCPQS